MADDLGEYRPPREAFGQPRNAEADAQLVEDMAAIRKAERRCFCWCCTLNMAAEIGSREADRG